jgi:hypothetical protein
MRSSLVDCRILLYVRGHLEAGQVKLTMIGVTLCEDLDRFIEHETKHKRIQRGHDVGAAEDALIASVEGEHGMAQPEVPLSLKVLCVRELYRQRHECAKGEANPVEVAANLTEAGYLASAMPK